MINCAWTMLCFYTTIKLGSLMEFPADLIHILWSWICFKETFILISNFFKLFCLPNHILIFSFAGKQAFFTTSNDLWSKDYVFVRTDFQVKGPIQANQDIPYFWYKPRFFCFETTDLKPKVISESQVWNRLEIKKLNSCLLITLFYSTL